MTISIKQLFLLVFLSAIGIAMAFNHQRGNEAKAQIKRLENEIRIAERELAYQKNTYNDALKRYQENSVKRIGLRAVRDYCENAISALQEKHISRQRIDPEFVSIKSLPSMRGDSSRPPVIFSIYIPEDTEVWLQYEHDLEILEASPSVSQNRQITSPLGPSPGSVVRYEAQLAPGYHVLEWIIPGFGHRLRDPFAMSLSVDSKLLCSSDFSFTSAKGMGTSGFSSEELYSVKWKHPFRIFSFHWNREKNTDGITERNSFDLRLNYKASGYDQFPELP